MSNQPKHKTWDWREEGFLASPTCVEIAITCRLQRIWGGRANEMGTEGRPGVCLTFELPKSRRHAEGLLAIFEWGNNAQFITTFELLPGARLFVGRVDPGDFHVSALGVPGSQVFVEMADFKRYARKVGDHRPLVNDMGYHFVVTNPAVHRPKFWN